MAQAFIAVIGLVAAIVTFCLMRFPGYRRPQFRQYGAFSILASLLGAAVILTLVVLMVLAQGAWQAR